ncbi:MULTISPECIES: helix-turn-helix domain-containing protein [Paraburkholderia]|uniref:helix-turn-helix domain-containing protein n=1 Tax=Paraburkholderia TaxID=1822464 RepID=UPI00224DFE93|nr:MULTISPECIES: helix-turn-helix transcriptional regulator [Paraburkholderia]MCX4177866.1 helix-turn-helix transcriptional regulator [Paraburkholderia madseniana]MDQ6465853.1 helix-turn-helix domain-containing protein [Paraburkholderia madseniana]
MEPSDAFGIVLRKRRFEACLTQEQLAFEADIQRVYVSKLELGHYQPTLTMLFTLAKALGCTASDLIVEVEQQLANSLRKKKTGPAIQARRVRTQKKPAQ